MTYGKPDSGSQARSVVARCRCRYRADPGTGVRPAIGVAILRCRNGACGGAWIGVKQALAWCVVVWAAKSGLQALCIFRLLRTSNLCEHETKAVFDLELMVGWGLHKGVVDKSGFSAYRVHMDWGLNFLSVMDLSPRRDYVYIDDLVDALVLSIACTNIFSVYNVGLGKSVSVQEIINVIQKVLNTNKAVSTDDQVRKNEIPDVVADISKAKSEFKWVPKISFEEGIVWAIKN